PVAGRADDPAALTGPGLPGAPTVSVRLPARSHRSCPYDSPETMTINPSMAISEAGAADSAHRRRWIALVVVCLAMFMNALDGSIVNVALPDIQKSLHFSQSGLTWVVDAYLISFGSFLLMAGRLGDL